MTLHRPPAWMAPLQRLEAKLRSKPSVVDATVVSVDPIRVQLDGKPAPVAPSPSTVVPVSVGDRVWVMHHGKTRLRIIGVIGGAGVLATGWTNIPDVIDGGATLDLAVSYPRPLPVVPSVVMLTATGSNRLVLRTFSTSITTSGFSVQARNVTSVATSAGSFWWAAIR